MGVVLEVPVQHHELIDILVSRCYFGGMRDHEKKKLLRRIESTVTLMLLLAPDVLNPRRLRM